MSKTDSVISAYSAEHVTKITGLTERQLAYWDLTEFFTPQFAPIGEGRSIVRIYSFRDLVSLRTLRVLRDEHKVSLQHLRKVAQKLSEYSDAPFAELKLRVGNREVYFDEPETGKTRAVLTGQYVLLPIIDIIRDVRRSTDALSKRNESDFGRIEQHRQVSRNARVIAGTRIPVRAIIHFIEDGFSIEGILEQYPSLTKEDIEATARDAGIKLAA